MEAFALAFDDPADAIGSELGERVGLAFDLEWEGTRADLRVDTPAEPDDGWGAHGRYETHCEVNGVVQLGDDEWDVAATGARTHEWGMLASTPTSAWRSDPTGRPDAAEPTDRHTLAVAPHLTDLADGSTARVRRTLDRLTYPTGPPSLVWTEAR